MFHAFSESLVHTFGDKNVWKSCGDCAGIFPQDNHMCTLAVDSFKNGRIKNVFPVSLDHNFMVKHASASGVYFFEFRHCKKKSKKGGKKVPIWHLIEFV